ncbi:hypothetical protein GF376_01745, partial [Candidatus Peregrinibacteria bacterium]|nr:hypothetical protein [Candidatus Peregrinibacteria bacterium]
MKAIEIIFGLIKIPTDFLLTISAFLLAYNIRLFTDLIPGIQLPITESEFPPINEYLIATSIAALILVLFFASAGMYSLKKPLKLSKQYWKILINSTFWLFLIISYYFIIRSFPFSRLALLQTWIFTIILVSIGRTIIYRIQQYFYQSGKARSNVLLVGSNNFTEEFVTAYFKNPEYNCIG